MSQKMAKQSQFKLAGREECPEDTHVRIGPVVVGGERVVVIAGPCAIESREQALSIAREVKKYGATLFRGGAFKPRSSPYSFQGLGEEGLKILAEVREETGMPVVTEITSPTQAEAMMAHVDVLQIGARNMQNYELLKCVGRLDRPVLLKRGLSATIEEWLMSAEYILSEGNGQVVLCERGIRTFEPYTRNTLDLSAIPVVRKLTHLPIVVDPSHATGIREKVAPMARAAIAAGADGVMIEVHNNPDEALSDGPQSLLPDQFAELMRDIYVIAPVIDKQLDFHWLEKAKMVAEVGDSKESGSARTAFFGELGSFGHKACMQHFGDKMTPMPGRSYAQVFEDVKSGAVDFGVVPLMNSLSGSVYQNYDLLLENDLKIVGEITLRTAHHLIAAAGMTVCDVKRVFSHPDVFQQCGQFLDLNESWELVATRDAAMAVRQVKERSQAGDAAIASSDAAEIHGLTIIKKGIDTSARNYTRFVVVAREPLTNRECTKSSLVYSVPDEPGTLEGTLRLFAESGVNMVKLESRHVDGKPWEYMFYVDVEADLASDKLKPVMAELESRTEYLKILGSY